MKLMYEHEHPLDLVDLLSEQLRLEEEYYEENEEENEYNLVTKDEFCCLCSLCEEEINWYHRYYYTCNQCDYSIHKFCAELPQRLDDTSHVHTLWSFKRSRNWQCDICLSNHKPHEYSYSCFQCVFCIDLNCATKKLKANIIYHPSHTHPLSCITKIMLCECDACGKEHKGFFYHCDMCSGPFIHSHCAFLPIKLQLQHTTNNLPFHVHPLTIAYSFPFANQRSDFFPKCRVCLQEFPNENIWIYKCEKCRYYTHLDCATSRNEAFMSILALPGTGKITKNYKDVEHPDLVHLPFPDPSYSILKHLFFKKDGSSTLEYNKITKTHISHIHPIVLGDAECNAITNLTSSKIKSISYHDPRKKIELLCNGCVRPITSPPIYMCANEDEHCNFVLHEWCSRLPTKLQDHFGHPKHDLILHSKVPRKFFGLFSCDICFLDCNGFVYCCEECDYHIDVNCAFLPMKITHTSHPNHILSIYYYIYNFDTKCCSMCGDYLWNGLHYLSCQDCDFYLNPACALLLPESTTHKCDKHPMKLSYFPIENHKGEYFCEICEEELNPYFSFYHCHECMQSIHPACAPSILQYETHASSWANKATHKFINVKFGSMYKNTEIHTHPLSFVQGIADDGNCDKCGDRLQYNMIFRCLGCKYAIHSNCCG